MDSTLNIKKKAIKCIDAARQNEKKLISALQNIAISGMGPDGVHNNPRFNFQLKQEFQEIFEKQHGHEKFMEVFGRNYLSMTYEEFIKKGVEVA